MVLPFVLAWIENEQGEILIGQHPDRDTKPYPLRWDLPGGKLEPMETPEEAVAREVKEETGFDVVSVGLADIYHSFGTDPECNNAVPGIGLCFRVEVSGSFSPHEMNDIHWVPKADLGDLDLTPWTEYFLRTVLVSQV